MSDNPWHRLPDSTPYVLPEDAAVVREFNCRVSDDYKLRIDELLPEPFVGNPNAQVVLLGNNPGFKPERVRYRQTSCFKARMRANLLHQNSACPFVFFDPGLDKQLRPWWERKLRGLLRRFKHEELARSILAVEHFPYPSRRYRGWRRRLPSKAQEYSYALVQRAIERKAVVILMRGKQRWLRAVPALDEYEGLCELRNPMAGSVSERNCPRFQDVVRAIEMGLAS